MIALSGGGTGGHLNIVKCLLEAASKANLECIYIGSENGQDKAWFENEPRFKAKFFLPSKGVVSQKGIKRLFALFDMLKLALKTRAILKEYKIKAVFSVGGYSAAPACFAALLSRTPLFIHEQNSKKGSLNALLKPFATRFYSAFEPVFCPYPVSDIFFDTQRVRQSLKTIIFLGGSQGASFINEMALNLAPSLNSKGVKIIHQCGLKELEKCTQAYAKMGLEAEVFAFDKNLSAKMASADLAISRAGASTLFELCANALPTIFIPYPYAAKNHQFYNALFAKEKAGAEIFTQNKELSVLLEKIFSLNLSEVSNKLKDLAARDGATFLLNDALGLIEK